MSKKIEIKETMPSDGMKKAEVISEIAKATNLKKHVVEDVLNAFSDLAIREQVTTGAFCFPGLPRVYRVARNAVLRYQPDLDVTLKYPTTFQLRCKMSSPVRKLHREMQRNLNNIENGVKNEDWWKPYFYCQGDWRKQGK